MSDAYAHLFADCTACGAQLHWHGRYTAPEDPNPAGGPVSHRFVRRFERHLDNGTYTSSDQAFTDEASAVADAKFSKHVLNGSAKNVRTYVDTYVDGKRLRTDEIE